jgi:hypothetical protein
MNLTPNRHGEARRAVAIQKFGVKALDRFATLAMTLRRRVPLLACPFPRVRGKVGMGAMKDTRKSNAWIASLRSR